MARSLLERRQDAERTRIEAYEASLRRVSHRSRPPPDFQAALNDVTHGFEAEVVRAPEAWQPQMKSRDAGRLRLAAARHLFARFPVASHLEQIWIAQSGLVANEAVLRKRWYVIAAGGRSLFKEDAGTWLSRKEVHAFLNPPGNLSFEQAFVYAIARSYTADAGVALRIAHTSVAQKPRSELGFWREVVRFFAIHPASVEAMNDLGDYLTDCFRRNPAYSLKGRTPEALARQMHAWHSDLAAIERIEAARRRAEAALARAQGLPFAPVASAGGSWTGATLADWSWQTSLKDRGAREQYQVLQLRTAADLVAETRAMHHCVASYAAKCLSGQASIWSLQCRTSGAPQRLLTIELDRQHRMVQVRGFANRAAHADEAKVLERWAKARGIVIG